jgi:hypothetical protein
LLELLAAVTGEQPDPTLSVAAQLLKRYGLVVRSPLLMKPIVADFSPRLVYSEIAEIAHRLDLLKDILEGKQREWAQRQAQFGGEIVSRYVAVGEPRLLDRSFRLPGSTLKWYWIDAEDELP